MNHRVTSRHDAGDSNLLTAVAVEPETGSAAGAAQGHVAMRRLTSGVVAIAIAVCAAGAAGGPAPAARRLLPADMRAPLSYVALGDSTVEGIGASRPAFNYVSRLHQRLRQVYPSARFVNLGEGGATAADVRHRQLPRAIELRPDLVTLSVGPNDITRERSLDAYARDIEAILRTLTVATSAVVIVNLLPDMAVTPRFRGKEVEPLVRERVIAFNEVLGRRAHSYGAEVVDLYEPSRREVPRRPELIAADLYHPSDQGYARWAELMWAGIEARRQR